MVNLIGFTAAVLTMFGFVPQIIKVIKLKSVKDISIIAVSQFTVGIFLWLIYGLCRRDIVIIVANSVSLASLLIFLFLCFRYGRNQ